MRKLVIALSIVFLICGMISIAGAHHGGGHDGGGDNDRGHPVAVPEPSTFLLLGSGLLGLIAFRIRRKR